MPSSEIDAILIEIGRGFAQASLSGPCRNKDAPPQKPGTAYLYNPMLGIMNNKGLSKDNEKERIGSWYRVVPDWTTIRTMIIRDPFSTAITADVKGEAERAYCLVKKLVNQNSHRFTYYEGTGIVLDVTDRFMLIWHDKLGLISHFNNDLNNKFIQLQVVNFKAESKSVSRHCAFHATKVSADSECRFKRLYCQSDATIKSYRTDACSKKILYALCPNGDRVLLLDDNKQLLREGAHEVQLEVGEKIEVVYYKIYARDKLVYISGFYFQVDEDWEGKEFWDSQWERFAETGMATDEDLDEKWANSKSVTELTDEEFATKWANHFKFWNPDREDVSWISDDFLVKVYKPRSACFAYSNTSIHTRSTATQPSSSRLEVKTTWAKTAQLVEEESIQPRIENLDPVHKEASTQNEPEESSQEVETAKEIDQTERATSPYNEIYTTPPNELADSDFFEDAENNNMKMTRSYEETVGQIPEIQKPVEDTPSRATEELEIVETVEFEEVVRERPAKKQTVLHPSQVVRKTLWQRMTDESRGLCFKKVINRHAQMWKNIHEDEKVGIFIYSVLSSNASRASNNNSLNSSIAANAPGPSNRPSTNKSAISEPQAVAPADERANSLLYDDYFNKHPKSLRFAKRADGEHVHDYLNRQMRLTDTESSLAVRNVLNKIVSSEKAMMIISTREPILQAILRQMYSYPDYVYIGHLSLLGLDVSAIESSGTAHLDRMCIERCVIQYIVSSGDIWESITKISPDYLRAVIPIEQYIFTYD